MISVIIPTATNSSGLRTCLESIIKHTDLSDVEILVVANGAPAETQVTLEVYRDYPVTLIWFPEMIGYTRACNVGMQAAKGSHFVLLNDDCVILGGHWLAMLMQPFLDDPLTAITGPLMLTAPECNREFLVFFCVMISRQVTESIGLLDEIYNPGYAEDCDFAMRAVDHGWRIQQVPSSQATLIEKGCEDLPQYKRDKMWHNPFPIYHDGNQTFGKNPKFEGLIKRNSAILMERYGPKVQEVQDPNWRAKTIDGWFSEDEIDWLAEQVRTLPKGAKVLEVGSWHGRSSRAIADALPEGAQSWHVDTWIGSSGEPEMHGSAHYERGDHAHQWWWCNLQEHIAAGRVVPVRMHSDNAAHTISHLVDKGQMEKFDLIFIDGDHSEEGIRTDVEAWLPLLKEGGLLCGHDYYKENEGPYWVFVRQYIEAKFPNVQKSATSIWHVRPHVEVVEQPRGKIVDCFIFNGELDLLDIRFATLDEVVDNWVLVEGTRTHSGNLKPLHFDENKERYSQYLHKIRHVIVDDWPADTGNVYEDAWAKERWQRDAILHGLTDCADNDIIILGDADEIASPEAVANYKVSDGLVRLKQRMFYYYLNCENKEGWDWQKIAPYSLVRELTPCGIRYPPAGHVPLVESGGWHFSFCGDTEHIAQKLRDYSHQEYNTAEVIARIDEAREQGVDIFGRDLKYEFVEIDESYPQYVQEYRAAFLAKGLIKDDEMRQAIEQRLANNGIQTAPDLSSRHWTVTATVSTKDRYTTTLPMCLAAIINQARKPDKLVVYDDSEQRLPAEQLCQTSPFDGLFKLLGDKGIEWSIQSTPRLGQVANHQHALDTATTEFIWRVDDDEIPEPNCLETLLNTIRDRADGDYLNIGAVGGLVHHPGAVSELPPTLTGSLADIDRGNIQWHSWNSGPREVEHLYSSFIYRTDVGREVGGYPQGLSVIGHREESWFSNKIHRAGYKLLVTPHTTTWHLREATGGIRSFADGKLWERDEDLFRQYLTTSGKIVLSSKIVILDAGIGDHLIFKGVFPEIRRKNEGKKFIIAACFPAVFEGLSDVEIISIADAKLLVGRNYDQYSLYRWMWDQGWTGHITDAMLEFWGT